MTDHKKYGPYEDEVIREGAANLAVAVVGKTITKSELVNDELLLTLSDGTRVTAGGSGSCCAWSEIERFLARPEAYENVITGVDVSYTDEGPRWFILAGMDPIAEVAVEAGEGSGYYSFGFWVKVAAAPAEPAPSGKPDFSAIFANLLKKGPTA